MKYILDALGIRNALAILMAFLLHDNLLANKCLIFYTDGADDIKNAIKTVFAWRPYRIILISFKEEVSRTVEYGYEWA